MRRVLLRLFDAQLRYKISLRYLDIRELSRKNVR